MVCLHITRVNGALFRVLLLCVICLAVVVISPATAVSRLNLASEPTSAHIYYYKIDPVTGTSDNGIYFGTTPKSILEIPDGTKVRIEFYKDGYAKKVAQLTISQPSVSYTAQMEPVPAGTTTGYLLVTSVPNMQDVNLSTGDSGVTPFVKQLPGGRRYTVKISDSWYVPYEEEVSLGSGKTVMVSATLEEGSVLTVFSYPSDARIVLDGADAGTTPKTINSLHPGAHTVELRLDNYENSVNQVNLVAGEEKQLDITLQKASQPSPAPGGPSPGTGTLSVTSTPSGAEVLSHGRVLGTTPMNYPGVEPGSGTLQIRLAGYQEQEVPFTITPDNTTLITVTLLEVPATSAGVLITTGTLSVTSSPSGAGVYENGVLIGATPLTVTGVDTGPRTIVVALDGYQDATETVTVPPGGTGRLAVLLVPETAGTPVATQASVHDGGGSSVSTGSLSVTSEPTAAGVYENGVLLGATPFSKSGMSPGLHTITIAADGYGDYVTIVTITPGSTTPVHAVLVPDTVTAAQTGSAAGSAGSSATGGVIVRSLPSAATAMIDGRVSRTTPASYPQVPAGLHSVTVSMVGYAPWKSDIVVKAGSTMTINAVLQPETQPATAGSTVSSAPEPIRTRRIPLSACVPIAGLFTGAAIICMIQKKPY